MLNFHYRVVDIPEITFRYNVNVFQRTRKLIYKNIPHKFTNAKLKVKKEM